MSGDRLLIAVAGPAGPFIDAVGDALASDAIVVDLGGRDCPRAVVLVNPAAEHWGAARAQRSPFVVVVGHDLTDEQVVNSVLWGAEAVLHPRDVGTRLRPVIDAVLAGETVLGGTEVRALAVAARTASCRARSSLSGREREIAELIAKGFAVKQTALALGISAKTVENLQSRLFRKLGVRNRAQAAAALSAMWGPTSTSHEPIPQDIVGELPS